MDFNIFSSTLHTKLGLLPLMTHGLSQCICGQSINSTSIHIFCFVHGRKCTSTHDAVRGFFTSIVRDVRFHVLHKQTHVLSTSSFYHHSNKWILCLQLMVLAFW
jgi:hypothetical protein